MTDKYAGPFGTYTAMVGITNATAKTELAAMFVSLKTLTNPTRGQSAPHPDFNGIPPDIAEKLGVEIDAIAAAVAASPSA
jgi:hypothetical protein